MPQTQRTFWYCRRGGGHVVGDVRYVTLQDGTGHIPVLALYETAQLALPEDGYEPQLRCEKLFHAEGLRCSICGQVYDWFPTLPALLRLLRRYERIS